MLLYCTWRWSLLPPFPSATPALIGQAGWIHVCHTPAICSELARLGKEKLLFAARDRLRGVRGRVGMLSPTVQVRARARVCVYVVGCARPCACVCGPWGWGRGVYVCLPSRCVTANWQPCSGLAAPLPTGCHAQALRRRPAPTVWLQPPTA